MDMLNAFAVALGLLKLNVPFLAVTNPYYKLLVTVLFVWKLHPMVITY